MSETTSAAADEQIDVVMAILKAWDKRDFTEVLTMFSEDAVLHSVMQDPLVGKASITARLSRLGAAAHTAKLHIRHIGVIDGLVFAERVDEIILHGQSIGVPVIGVFEVKDGLVKHWREFYDRRQLLGAMGIVEDFDKTAR